MAVYGALRPMISTGSRRVGAAWSRRSRGVAGRATAQDGHAGGGKHHFVFAAHLLPKPWPPSSPSSPFGALSSQGAYQGVGRELDKPPSFATNDGQGRQ